MTPDAEVPAAPLRARDRLVAASATGLPPHLVHRVDDLLFGRTPRVVVLVAPPGHGAGAIAHAVARILRLERRPLGSAQRPWFGGTLRDDLSGSAELGQRAFHLRRLHRAGCGLVAFEGQDGSLPGMLDGVAWVGLPVGTLTARAVATLADSGPRRLRVDRAAVREVLGATAGHPRGVARLLDRLHARGPSGGTAEGVQAVYEDWARGESGRLVSALASAPPRTRDPFLTTSPPPGLRWRGWTLTDARGRIQGAVLRDVWRHARMGREQEQDGRQLPVLWEPAGR